MTSNQTRKNGIVAIVSTDNDNRNALYQVVSQSWGYPTIMFDNCETALRQLTPAVDAVVLGFGTPGANDEETLRRFQDAGDGVPVIRIGSAGQEETVQTLESAVKHAVHVRALEREVRYLRSALMADERAARPSGAGNDEEIKTFESLKEDALRQALQVTGGNAVEAARRLKIGRATLYRLAKKFQITI